MITSWVAIVLVLALLGSSMTVLSIGARRFSASAEGMRKLLHVEMALVTLSFPWIFSSAWPVILLACASVAWLLMLRASGRLKARFGFVLHAVRRNSRGEIWFACGVCLTYLWSAAEPVAYCIAILVLALADTAAALIGQRLGRARRMPGGASKSLAGSIAFFSVALAVSFAGLYGAGFRPGEALAAASLVAVITTVVEAVLWDGLDNLFVPLGALASLDSLAFIVAQP